MARRRMLCMRKWIVVAGLAGAAACSSHQPSSEEREPEGAYLLRADEAPKPVPEGVEMWVDAKSIDLEVGGERQRVFEFGPTPPSKHSRGDPRLRELLSAERNAMGDPHDNPALIVHVDPTTPSSFLGHALYMAYTAYWFSYAFVVETPDGPRAVFARQTFDSLGERGLLTSLHVEVSAKGTTAQWHVPDTGPAPSWDNHAAIDGRACAPLPGAAVVRAALRALIDEGCAGASISPKLAFERSLALSHDIPSGLLIQALAALARSCRADSYPWLTFITDEPLTHACEAGWAGEVHDYTWFRDEALRRARIDL